MFRPDHFLNVYVEHFSHIQAKIFSDNQVPSFCDFVADDTTFVTYSRYTLYNDNKYNQIKNCLEMPEEQWVSYWNNIVEVFSNIEVHRDNFRMEDWHCGSSHCLAGWAQYLFLRDNYVKWCYQDSHVNPFIDGEKLLSPVISAFFWFINETDLIYNQLILPVLEEARKDDMIPFKKVEPVSIAEVACVA
jgi:hypothetical protein